MKYPIMIAACALCVIASVIKVNTDEITRLVHSKAPVPESIKIACEDVFDTLETNMCKDAECEELYRDEATCIMLFEVYKWD